MHLYKGMLNLLEHIQLHILKPNGNTKEEQTYLRKNNNNMWISVAVYQEFNWKSLIFYDTSSKISL